MSFNPVEGPSRVFTFIKLKPDVIFIDLTCVKIDNIIFRFQATLTEFLRWHKILMMYVIWKDVIIALAFRLTVQLCARLDSTLFGISCAWLKGSLGDSELKKHCFWNTFDFYNSLAGKENEKKRRRKGNSELRERLLHWSPPSIESSNLT